MDVAEVGPSVGHNELNACENGSRKDRFHFAFEMALALSCRNESPYGKVG